MGNVIPMRPASALPPYDEDRHAFSRAVYDSLALYVDHHLPPSTFLCAVLSGKLINAVITADEQNADDLCAIVRFLYWEVSGAAWGNTERFEAWLKGGKS